MRAIPRYIYIYKLTKIIIIIIKRSTNYLCILVLSGFMLMLMLILRTGNHFDGK
jgi:hypothetical protein